MYSPIVIAHWLPSNHAAPASDTRYLVRINDDLPTNIAAMVLEVADGPNAVSLLPSWADRGGLSDGESTTSTQLAASHGSPTEP